MYILLANHLSNKATVEKNCLGLGIYLCNVKLDVSPQARQKNYSKTKQNLQKINNWFKD